MSGQNVSIPLDQFASVLHIVGVLSSPTVNGDAMINALRLLQRMFLIHKCSFIRKRRDQDEEPALVVEYIVHVGTDHLERSRHPGLAAIDVLLGEIDRVQLSDRAFSWQRSVLGKRDFDASGARQFVAAHGLGASNLAFQDGNGLDAMTVILECFEQPSAENCLLFQALAPFLLCSIPQWKLALEPLNAAKPLTAKEAQIIAWVSEGKTSWEVGKILLMSERTVKFHLKNIYAKFNVVNRAQAVSVFGKRLMEERAVDAVTFVPPSPLAMAAKLPQSPQMPHY